jgi:hypothetical protein
MQSNVASPSEDLGGAPAYLIPDDGLEPIELTLTGPDFNEVRRIDRDHALFPGGLYP